MFIHSLKSKILINLIILLFLAVLLSDFVIVTIIQKKLILQKIQTGHSLLLKLKSQIHVLPDPHVHIIFDPSVIYGFIEYDQGKQFSFGEFKRDINLDIPSVTREAVYNGMPQILYSGVTWGVFWKQKKYLTISMPFHTNPDQISAGTIVIQLDDIYKSLRASHMLVVFYLIVNSIILLMFWFYRFSRMVFKPVQKIIRIAKEYSNSDNLRFAPEKRYYEFNELSSALNRMIQRIETDNEKLKNSLKMLQEVNAELKTTQAEMIRAEKLVSIGRLSAGIAHEIGNPISIVLGYLGLLKNRPGIQSDSTIQDYIDRATKEINRINNIIRQLLDFSRTAPVRFCPVSIHCLIKDVVKTMTDQPLMANIEIECHLSAAKDSVYADYNQLSQVFINLLINAADSIAILDNKLKGKITIFSEVINEAEEKVMKNKPALKLLVTDNGTGISSKDLDNIFDPFYTTKDPGKGTGLGLSVCFMIIEQIGGSIFADSEIGKGTTMTILLPLFDCA